MNESEDEYSLTNDSTTGSPKQTTAAESGDGHGPKPELINSRRFRKNKPNSALFYQQRMLAYRPVLTPQKAIPFLLILGLVFIPLGIMFLINSSNIVEYSIDYTDCLTKAKPEYTTLSGVYQWRKQDQKCYIRFTTDKNMKGPVYLYYELTNFYQNNRLYAKSYNYQQLMGEPLLPDRLKECEPLVVHPGSTDVYYPCGLVANSFFSDRFSVSGFRFHQKGIGFAYDKKMYGPSLYDLSKQKVYPPKSWSPEVFDLDLNKDGSYRTLPKLHEDENFQNWMRLSGLSTFRKLYAKNDGDIPAGTPIEISIDSNYDTKAYGGTKALILSTTSWIGGKTQFLGYAYVCFGAILIVAGLVFLGRHLLAPRMIGDVRYLSWYPIS